MASLPMPEEKLLIVMVGLPARGKSYITKKISNYLQWLNIENRVFNVGNKRRTSLDDEQNADFFDPNHKDNVKIRDELAIDTLDEVINYLQHDGQVGIFDATNSTAKRRRMVIDHVNKHFNSECNILFLESICNNRNVIEQNILLKLNGPDYKGNKDKTAALGDFKKRLQNYETVYESVQHQEFQGNERCQFLKIIDIYNLKSFNIQGFLPIMLNNFLQHYNVVKKKIWVSLAHIDYHDVKDIINNPDLLVFNPTSTATKRIPQSLSLDQVHDLLLEVEAAPRDLLIQSQDELLINGIMKYFKLFEENDCHPDFTTQMICIMPHHYSVGLQRFNVHEIPEMTRSNSNISNTSSILTPREDLDWTQFNYQNLSLSDLTSRLEQLK